MIDRPKLGIMALLILWTGLASAGTIDTVAGTGQRGSGGDGGQATACPLREPFHVDLDRRGGLLIADAADHKIRRVDLATGIIVTLAGDGQAGTLGDAGPAMEARINSPYALVADDAAIYFVEQLGRTVRRVDRRSGRIDRLAGTGEPGGDGDGGPAVLATFREPNDLFLDGRGGLLVADVADWRVRRVDLDTGRIAPFAGAGRRSRPVDRSRIGDGGPARDATILGARGVCVDGKGNVTLCEREGNAIRKVDPAGIITTIAGTGEAGYSGDDGPALAARFRGPKGVRSDLEGNLYVVDTENHAIRRIDVTTGLVSTVAGGHKGPDGDGGEATLAGLDRPHGCVIDSDGTLYIADSDNHRVRRVKPLARTIRGRAD